MITVAEKDSSSKKVGRTSDAGMISLESFVSYKPNRTGFEFFPLPRNQVINNGRTSIVLGDVPLPDGIPAPQNALTVLYGFKDALDEIKSQYAFADEQGMDLVKVNLKLDVGQIIPGSTKLSDLTSTRFLNLQRADEELQRIVLDGVNDLLVKTTKKPKLFEKILDCGARPDLICEFIRQEPIFRQINSVVYQIPNGTPRGRQVATVFSTNFSEITFRGEGAFDIELPRI
jgi:hypothetical protein